MTGINLGGCVAFSVHEGPGHVVADEARVDPLEGELEGRQPGTLQGHLALGKSFSKWPIIDWQFKYYSIIITQESLISSSDFRFHHTCALNAMVKWLEVMNSNCLH